MAHAQINLTASLSACYGLNANGAEPVNGLTGTLSAVTPTVDRFNTSNAALQFAGNASSYVQLPDNPLLKPSNAISFSAWVRFDQLSSPQYLVFTKNTSFSNFESYALVVSTNGTSFKFRVHKSNGNTLTDFIDGTTNLSPNTWYHVAFTMDNSNLMLYTNGVLQNTSATTHTFNYQPGKNVVLGGTNEPSFNGPFKGCMDNVRFYNRVINPNEVGTLYNQDPVCQAPGVPPVASFVASAIRVCEGGVVNLIDNSTNSPSAWNWQASGASPLTSTLSNPSFTFPVAGNYVISLTASNSFGSSNTATQAIVVLPNPTLNLMASSNTVCAGQTSTLVVSGALAYTWSTAQTGPVIVVNPSGTTVYSVLGVDLNGCSSQQSINLQVSPLPTVTAVSSKSLVCVGSNFTLTANGALNYVWSNFQSGVSINLSSTLLGAGPHVFTVTGFNANACASSATVGLLVSDCVSIQESGWSQSPRIYPNPCKDNLTIQFSEDIQGFCTLNDANGKKLYELPVENKKEVDLKIKDLEPGFYDLQINTFNQIHHLKLIKVD